MTGEAVIVELAGQPKGVPIRYNIADTVAIEKGTLLGISGAAVNRYADARDGEFVIATARAAADSHPFAGIAATEKVANDGQTTIGCWTKGLFDLTAVSKFGGEGAIRPGTLVVLSGTNLIRAAIATDVISGAILGKAMEDIAAAGVGQVAVGVYN